MRVGPVGKNVNKEIVYICEEIIFVVISSGAFTDLLVISHQHQLNVLGLRQDVSFTLQHRKYMKSLGVKCIMGVGVLAHPAHVRGAVDGWHSGVRDPTASGSIALRSVCGEQKVEVLV